MTRTSVQDPQRQTEPPRHRPLIPVLLGFAAGIWLDKVLEPVALLWAAAACVALGAALTAVLLRSRPRVNWVLSLLVLMPLGGAWHLVRARDKPPWHLARLLTVRERLCRVQARVTRGPELHRVSDPWGRPATTDREFWLVQVDARAVALDGGEWTRTAGGLAVFAFGGRPEVRVGDEVEFLAFLRPNRSATNPGEVDMREVYERFGSVGTASVYSPRAFDVTRRAYWHSSLPAAVGAVRNRVEETLIRGPRRPASGLAVALVLGERSLISDATEELLRESGAVQFIAISGLHVGLFAAFLWALLLHTRVPVQARSLTLIGLVWLYVLLTGCQASAQRAGWMLTFLAAAPLLQRRWDGLSAIAGAALVILAIQPQELFAVGFQFTFVAVWAIVYLYGNLASILWPWDALVERLQQPSARTLTDDLLYYGRHCLLLSFSVWLALAPLHAHYFHTFCIYTPLVNVLLWPLMVILIVGSFLLLPAALLGGLTSAPLVSFTGLMSAQCEALLQWVSRLPGFVAHTPGPPGWWLAIFYVVVILWVVRARAGGGHRLFLAGVIILGAGYVWTDLHARNSDTLTVAVADVGHGQCAAFRLPSGATMLCDAGASIEKRPSAIEGILWEWRVHRIRALVISHRDMDHCRFVPNLLRKFDVDKVVLPPRGVDEQQSVVDEKLREMRAQRVLVWEGAELQGDGLRCEILHPDDRFLAETGLGNNERSLVLMCEFRGWRILLTGDVEEQALRRLVDRYGSNLRADVLVLPHHGAWRESLKEFLERVRPSVAIASCSDDVDLRTRELLAVLRIPLWTTARHGAVTIVVGERELKVMSHLRPEESTFVRGEARAPAPAAEGVESR